jgi:hypothetical protein
MYSQGHVLEHRSSPGGRWLRARRLRIALGIAIVEGVLTVAGILDWWLVIAITAVAVGFYLLLGRNLRFDTAKQSSWIAAASQAFVVLVPVLVAVIGGLAIMAVALLAVVALIVLFSDRR